MWSRRRLLASRAALLLLSIIHFTNLGLPSFFLGESLSPSVAMSAGQQALQKLKALGPVQQRRAAAILGALLADVASKWMLLLYAIRDLDTCIWHTVVLSKK